MFHEESSGARAPEYATQIASAVKRPGLGTLCEQLERHIARTAAASQRIHEIGDQMFGPRPEDNACSAPEDRMTLQGLLSMLDENLSRIESGLSRF